MKTLHFKSGLLKRGATMRNLCKSLPSSDIAPPKDIYGMHVTQCLVRDGLGWSEQALINEEGCPQVLIKAT